jgi:allophanate hydrolase subunit 2
VGYRLEGARINPPLCEMCSEPQIVGSIQVPPNGQPIVTMRDGPTVGGYPKIGIVDPESLSWLAQCRPGVRFRWVEAE